MCFVLGDVRPDAKSEYFRRRILPLWSAQAKGLRDIPSNSPIDIKEFQQRGEVSRCLEGEGVSGKCLEVCVWRGVCLEGCVWTGRCLEGVCLDRKVSGWCLEGYVRRGGGVGLKGCIWKDNMSGGGVSGGECLEMYVWRGCVWRILP